PVFGHLVDRIAQRRKPATQLSDDVRVGERVRRNLGLAHDYLSAPGRDRMSLAGSAERQLCIEGAGRAKRAPREARIGSYVASESPALAKVRELIPLALLFDLGMHAAEVEFDPNAIDATS